MGEIERTKATNTAHIVPDDSKTVADIARTLPDVKQTGNANTTRAKIFYVAHDALLKSPHTFYVQLLEP